MRRQSRRRVSGLIIEPIMRRVTYAVVKRTWWSDREFLVPFASIVDSSHLFMLIDGYQRDLASYELFVPTDGAEERADEALTWHMPTMYATPWSSDPFLIVSGLGTARKRVPDGCLLLSRGARVEGVDGPIGKMAEYVLDPANGRIEYLIVATGPWWQRRRFEIAGHHITYIEDNVIQVSLGKDGIAEVSSRESTYHWAWAIGTTLEAFYAFIRRRRTHPVRLSSVLSVLLMSLFSS